MRRFQVVVTCLSVLPFGAVLGARQFPSPNTGETAAGQPQTIHLDVLVKDQSGQPLHGLPEQAFAVLDNGQPQKLVDFTPVDVRSHPSAVHVLIVLDMINTGYTSVTWGREQLSEYLKQEGGSLTHRTSIAAMTEDGLKMMSGSSTDGNALQAEFQKIATDLRPVTQSAGWQGLDQLMEQSLQQFSQVLAIEQTRPGRKLVLFISPGWPMLGWQGSEEDLHTAQWVFNVNVRLTNAVRDARTTIYRLDPFEIGGAHAGAQDPFYYQAFLKPVTNPKKATFPFLGLGVFALHSGGRVLVTGHDVTGELNSAMRDAGSYYELTYAAPPPGAPNAYHAISVRVDQPGASVQTLAGYYADPQNVGPEPKEKKKR
ncbi:MAG TPA: VWA domain-containing protein [Terracidiphilus sp.]|nr:VWA domain-containing protein [Terracidiphilus sp.]